MKQNMGTADNGVRILVAIVIFALYFTGTIGGTLGIILMVLAVVFVGTSLLGSCPLYIPLGLSTKKDSKSE